MKQKRQKSLSKPNFRDLAIGFLLAVCIILTLGTTDSSENEPGRYQSCPAGDSSQAVFVIDTQTGRTWRLGRTDTYYYGTPQKRESVRRGELPLVK